MRMHTDTKYILYYFLFLSYEEIWVAEPWHLSFQKSYLLVVYVHDFFFVQW